MTSAPRLGHGSTRSSFLRFRQPPNSLTSHHPTSPRTTNTLHPPTSDDSDPVRPPAITPQPTLVPAALAFTRYTPLGSRRAHRSGLMPTHIARR